MQIRSRCQPAKVFPFAILIKRITLAKPTRQEQSIATTTNNQRAKNPTRSHAHTPTRQQNHRCTTPIRRSTSDSTSPSPRNIYSGRAGLKAPTSLETSCESSTLFQAARNWSLPMGPVRASREPKASTGMLKYSTAPVCEASRCRHQTHVRMPPYKRHRQSQFDHRLAQGLRGRQRGGLGRHSKREEGGGRGRANA